MPWILVVHLTRQEVSDPRQGSSASNSSLSIDRDDFYHLSDEIPEDWKEGLAQATNEGRLLFEELKKNNRNDWRGLVEYSHARIRFTSIREAELC